MGAAVFAARGLVRQRLAEGGWIPQHHDYPTLGAFAGSGFPSISHIGDGPPEYSRLFGRSGGSLTPLGFDEVAGLDALLEYARGDERLRKYLGPPDISTDAEVDELFDILVAIRTFDLLDRAIQLHGIDFSEGDLLGPYCEIEASLLQPRLAVEVWVPIALTGFEEEADIASGVRLKAIPEPLQLMRVPSSIFGGAAHECVVDAATHALVLEGYEIDNENLWLSRDISAVRDPPAPVLKFFSALRLATGIETGWAQIFLRPLGWARDFTANLPPVASAGVARRYPPWWDDRGWLTERPAVSSAQLAEVIDLYARMESISAKMQLSLRRLDSAMLREDRDDAVVDILVGLEAALGDRSPTEMTHKLSMRVAALAALDANRVAALTFTQMKKIYSYRSAIVHGGNRPASTLPEADGTEVDLLARATDLLREVLLVLLHEPRWREPAAIDSELLLGEPAERRTPNGEE
jgi:hypothetical protein